MNKILLSLIIILSLVGNSYGDSLTNVLANDHKVVINSDGIRMTSKGVVKMPETTTPTATSGSGAVYTKTDNKLYFQDGDGTEHSAILNDTTNYTSLTNDSMVDSLHRHSELSASDGTPNPALSVDAGGAVSTAYALSAGKPANYWGPASFYGINGAGQLDHHGSNEITLTSNGYRTSTGVWESYGIGGNTGAAMISLNPAGTITFRTDADKADGTSTIVTSRMQINSVGNTAIGTVSSATSRFLSYSTDNSEVNPVISAIGAVNGENTLITIQADNDAGTARHAAIGVDPDEDNLFIGDWASGTTVTKTLNVDLTNSRLGLGVVAPESQFHMSSFTPVITMTDQSTSAISEIDANSPYGSIAIEADTGNTVSSSAINFSVDGVSKASITPTALELVNNIKLPRTTYADQNGIINKSTVRFLHDFNYGDNGTVTTTGRNTYVGEGAGNLTAGSTATSTAHSSYNTGVGYGTLLALTIGYQNSCVGLQSGYKITEGIGNSLFGYLSGYEITDGDYNTCAGAGSLQNIRATSNNVGIGTSAGKFIADGTTALTSAGNSVYVGTSTKASADSVTNENVFGYGATGKGSNTITLGNSSITGIYAQVTSITSLSDRRIKKDIEEIDPIQANIFINALKPITYKHKNPANWDEDVRPSEFKNKVHTSKVDKIKKVKTVKKEVEVEETAIDDKIGIVIRKKVKKIVDEPVIETRLVFNDDGSPVMVEMDADGVKSTVQATIEIPIEEEVDEVIPEETVTAEVPPADNNTKYAGLIAQETKDALTLSGVKADIVDRLPNGLLAVKYTELIPYMIATIKVQSGQIANQDKRIKDLESRLSLLESKIQ